MQPFYLKHSQPKNPYGPRVPRPEFSTEELVAFLVDNDIRGSRELSRMRESEDPALWDYQKHFYTWSQAIEYAYPDPIGDLIKIHIDHEYIMKTVLVYRLWTYQSYCNVRRLLPDVVPSMRQVRKSLW